MLYLDTLSEGFVIKSKFNIFQLKAVGDWELPDIVQQSRGANRYSYDVLIPNYYFKKNANSTYFNDHS